MNPGELKPCPICGSTDTVLNSSGMTGTGTSYVACLSCNTEGPYFDEDQEEKAIKAWNTRVLDPALTAQQTLREALEQAIHWLEDGADQCDLTDLKAALLGQPGSAWRPIAEADKKQRVDCHNGHNRFTNCVWSEVDESWNFRGMDGRWYDSQATHFMPLPPPPGEGVKKELVTVEKDRVVMRADGSRYVAGKPHPLPDGARLLEGRPHEEGTECQGFDYTCGSDWCKCSQ